MIAFLGVETESDRQRARRTLANSLMT